MGRGASGHGFPLVWWDLPVFRRHRRDLHRLLAGALAAAPPWPPAPLGPIVLARRLLLIARRTFSLRQGGGRLSIVRADRKLAPSPLQAQVGEASGALESLELVLTTPAPFSIHFVVGEGAFDSLRDRPRYRELIERFSKDVVWPAPSP